MFFKKINKDKVQLSITALVPGNACTFRCAYCYNSQLDEKAKTLRFEWKYPVEQMIKAFDPKRLGGIACIGVIGEGETLLPDTVVPFVHGLLNQGHFVEVVTNMSLTNRIDELLNTTPDNLKRLLVKGSLHWNELKRLHMVDQYFDNMKKVINAGASSYPFLVVNKDYMPFLDEIRQTCLDKLGALPQCTGSLVFDDKKDIQDENIVKTSPECTKEFTDLIEEKFHSKVFDVFLKFLKIKPSQFFCYAGQWSFTVNLATGDIHKCHFCPSEGNFFENVKKKIKLSPIGHNCCVSTCALQYNFIGQGLIPQYKDEPSYMELMDRKPLFNETARRMLHFKYNEYKKVLSLKEEKKADKKTRELFNRLRCTSGHYLSLKNKIRYKIWRHLDNKLKKKGIIK